MTKASNAFGVLKKNLAYPDLIELIGLISGYLEEESQEYMKQTMQDDLSHRPTIGSKQ
jgi:hypothetical protein